jgi:hypothetical protein
LTKSTTVALAVVAVVSASFASTVHADTTRPAYVAQVEPICQANTEANRTILAGVQRRVAHRKLRIAGRQVARAARAFTATLSQVAAVAPPTADAGVIAGWIASLRVDGSYLYRISNLLKKRRDFAAEGVQIQLSRNTLQTNNIIAGWGFNYCLISSSNFLF